MPGNFLLAWGTARYLAEGTDILGLVAGIPVNSESIRSRERAARAADGIIRPMRKSSLSLACLSASYLLLPAFLFAWGWLRWPYALLTTLAAGGFLAMTVRDVLLDLRSAPDRPRFRDWLRLSWPALLVVIAWLSLSGIGGLGLQNGDYTASNALLKALIAQPWPLQIHFQGETVNIVYYVGYYLPAAAVGKAFGWAAANVFLFAWSFAGIWLAFLWFRRISPAAARPRQWLVLALVFCLASGMDVVGYYLIRHNPFEWGQHIETWSDFFQFSSQTTLLFWVPQQALAAWLIAGQTYACLEEPRLFRYLGMALAAAVLWSPFGVLGMVPYVLALGITFLGRKQLKLLAAPASILPNLASLWVGGIHLLYLSSNRYDFPSGLLWNLVEDRRAYAIEAVEFWFIEVGLLAMAVGVLWALLRRLRRGEATAPAGASPPWGWMALAGLTSIALLLFKMGLRNDLVMRGSIPSLFYFWALVGWALIEAGPWLKLGRIKAALALILLLLLVGSYTSFSEIGRSVAMYHFGPPDKQSVGTIVSANNTITVAQRVGRADTFFYRHLSR